MRPSRRFLLIGVAVGAAELLLAVACAGTGLGGYFAACAAMTWGVSLLGSRVLAGGPPPDAPGRGGASGPDPQLPPSGPSSGDEPAPWRSSPPGGEDGDGDPRAAGGLHEDDRVLVPG